MLCLTLYLVNEKSEFLSLSKLPNNGSFDKIREAVSKLKSRYVHSNLMYSSSKESHQKLRDILCNLISPSTVFDNISEEEENLVKNSWFNENLNKIQMETILHCLKSRELALIHGPPGTGKTTTIVELILQHARLHPRSKILCCAPSNTAVDNIAEKLINRTDPIPIVCVGHPARMSESVLCRWIDALKLQSGEEYSDSCFNTTSELTQGTKFKLRKMLYAQHNKMAKPKDIKIERSKKQVKCFHNILGSTRLKSYFLYNRNCRKYGYC